MNPGVRSEGDQWRQGDKVTTQVGIVGVAGALGRSARVEQRRGWAEMKGASKTEYEPFCKVADKSRLKYFPDVTKKK